MERPVPIDCAACVGKPAVEFDQRCIEHTDNARRFSSSAAFIATGDISGDFASDNKAGDSDDVGREVAMDRLLRGQLYASQKG